MNLKKIILNIIFIIITFIIQISFINPLTHIFYNLNLLYIILLILLFFDKLYLFLFWTIISSFILDYFSSLPFGFMFIIFTLSVSLMYLIFIKIINNKSFYGLVIFLCLGIIIFNTIFYTLINLYNFLLNKKTFFSLKLISIYSIKQILLIVIASLIFLVYRTIKQFIKNKL